MKTLVFDINCSVDSFNIKVLEITAKKFSQSPLFPFFLKQYNPTLWHQYPTPLFLLASTFDGSLVLNSLMYQKKCTGLKKLRNVTKVIILSMRGNSYIYNWPLGLRDQITLIAENA